MSLTDKTKEIDRLIRLFETEADKFHEIDFHTRLFVKNGDTENQRFHKINHAIMLWQYIGQLGEDGNVDRFAGNLDESDLKWGIRGAELTNMGIIEGPGTQKFVRMAKRAGSLFNEKESYIFQTRVVKEIQEQELKKDPTCMPAVAVNGNPLAIWLNYLLFYLSNTYPDRTISSKIEPDLFTLSLLAIEQLRDKLEIEKSDRSTQDLTQIKFKVAMSFPGEKRKYVSRVVDILRSSLGPDTVFYDFDYQAQIARPNADILLQNVYHKQSDLIVVFLCNEYSKKQWCGLEWRSIRDLIKSKQDEKIMLVKFDQAQIEGVFSIDGYIDASRFNEKEVAAFILQRINFL